MNHTMYAIFVALLAYAYNKKQWDLFIVMAAASLYFLLMSMPTVLVSQ